jgi:hypothetical protein
VQVTRIALIIRYFKMKKSLDKEWSSSTLLGQQVDAHQVVALEFKSLPLPEVREFGEFVAVT